MASSGSWIGALGRRVGTRLVTAGLVAGTSALGIAALPPQAASATPTAGSTYYVNSATDTGAVDCTSATNTDCGIDDAIAYFDVDGNVGDADTIVFSPSITTFTVGTTTVMGNPPASLAIKGNGPAATKITGGNADRVFAVGSGTTVTISGLTIEDGQAPAGSAGPALTDNPTYDNDTVDFAFNNGGDGGNGGGVENLGNLTLTNDMITGNSAGTGGVPGSVNETIEGNDDTINVTDGGTGSAGGDGGGIYNASVGRLTLADDTISGNTAGAGADNTSSFTLYLDADNSVYTFAPIGARGGRGGGIFNAGTLTATNDTVYGNTGGAGGYYGTDFITGLGTESGSTFNFTGEQGGTGGDGGGIDNLGTAALASVTMTHNSVGSGGSVEFGKGGANGAGGAINNGATLGLGASILAESTGNDCTGSVTDEGYNIDDDPSCALGSSSTDNSTTVDSFLGTLTDNGGPTFTVALTAGSPAVGLVDSAATCARLDQRGRPRPTPVCDAGAFELTQPSSGSTSSVSVTPTGGTAVVGNGDSLTDALTVTGTNGGPAPSNSPGGLDFYVCHESSSTTFSPGVCPASGTPEDAGEILSGSGDQAEAESTFFPTGIGTWCFSTNYAGDADYGGSSDNTTVVDNNECALVSPASPTITTTPSASTVSLGTTSAVLKDTAVLAAGYQPTGTITFTLYKPGGILVDTEMATVSGNGSYTTKTGYSLPNTGTVTGTYQWDASYQPADANNNGVSENNAVAEQVKVTSPCGALTGYVLTATSSAGNFTGIFCVNASGSGTYSQNGGTPVTGTVKVSGGTTGIAASGPNLVLLGQKTSTYSSFTETAPAPMKTGTFVLTALP